MADFSKMTLKEKQAYAEKLRQQIKESESKYNYYKAMQLALKLVLNGTYGALCHKSFAISNSEIANSITASAREVINYMLSDIEKYFYEKWHNDTEIHKALGTAYISKYNDGYYIHRSDGMLMDKKPREDDEKSTGKEKIMHYYYLNESDIIENDRESFTIKDKEYIIIEKFFIHDFSQIIPLPTGYTVLPSSNGKEYDAGIRKTPIIIYGDTDSLYISFTPIAKYCNYKGDMMKFILHMNGAFVKHLFTSMLCDYAKQYGVENIHDFELETINASGMHIAKKMYINNCVWEDGIHYENLSKFKPKGVDIVRSSTPQFVREKIWTILNYLFENAGDANIKDVLKLTKNIKSEFMLTDIEMISNTTSLNNYDLKAIDDTEGVKYEKGAHFSIRAAVLHNYLLNKNPEYKTKYEMLRNEKIKYYACKHPLGEKFAYGRGFHPTEIVAKENVEIDYDTQFQKTFLGICNRFLIHANLPPINKRISVLNQFFTISKEEEEELVFVEGHDDDSESIFVPTDFDDNEMEIIEDFDYADL